MEILSKFDGDKSPCPSNVPAPLLHQNENKIKNHKKIQHRKNRSRKKTLSSIKGTKKTKQNTNMKTNLIQISNFQKMSKQKRNQNKQMIIVLPDPKFVKRPDFFLKTTKKKTNFKKKLLDNLVLDLMHAILDS